MNTEDPQEKELLKATMSKDSYESLMSSLDEMQEKREFFMREDAK